VYCKFGGKKKLVGKVFPLKCRVKNVFIPSDAENPRLILSPRESLRQTRGGGGTAVKKKYLFFL